MSPFKSSKNNKRKIQKGPFVRRRIGIYVSRFFYRCRCYSVLGRIFVFRRRERIPSSSSKQILVNNQRPWSLEDVEGSFRPFSRDMAYGNAFTVYYFHRGEVLAPYPNSSSPLVKCTHVKNIHGIHHVYIEVCLLNSILGLHNSLSDVMTVY